MTDPSYPPSLPDVLALREIREGRTPRLSQEGLARLAGCSVKTVRRAEAGGSVSSSTLEKLAAALGVPVGDLFTPQIQEASV